MNYFITRTVVLSFYFAASLLTIGRSQVVYENIGIESKRQAPNPKKRFLQLLSLGAYYKTAHIHKADSFRQVLLTKSLKLDDWMRFSALLYSTEINQITGNTDDYFKNVLALRPFLNKLKSDHVIFKIYHHLGCYHSISQNFDSAKFYLQAASEIGLRIGINADIAENYNSLALCHMHRGSKDSALYYSDLALTYGRRSSGKKMMDESLNIKALIFNYFGQIELSVAKNILAADWAERTNDKYHLAQYYREIGMAQRLIHNPAAAEFYLNRSYSYSRQIADYRQMALSLIGLAYILYDQQEYDAAVLKINEALRKMTSIHDNISIGEAHNLLGLVYREKKHYRKASISLANALLFFQSARNLEKIAEVYHNAGSLFVRQKKIKKALNYLFRSVDLRKKSGDRYQLCESYRVISQIYRDLGQPAKALVYLENYVRTLDSNSLVSATKQIADLSENYRSELRFRLIQSQADSIVQQQKNKALTETKLENSQLRNDLQLYIIIVMLLFAFLAGIIIFYRTKQVKLKQQQRETELSQTLLRAQMNPHFVFNAMSVIQSYIYENDTINSTKFLVNFSRLMRLILENSSREFIPVETEIEILEKYLAIQKLRFGDRFDFTIDMSENITPERAVIPPMITQPFVENAIEHGQLHANEEGTIYIRFRRSEKYLEVTIEDNGIGRSHAEQNKKSRTHKSMAMTITRERIQILNKKYGTEGFLDVQDLHPDRKTGTKVLIWLPYREDNLPTSET